MAFSEHSIEYATTDFINVWNAYVQLTYSANRLEWDDAARRWKLDGVTQQPTNVSLSMIKLVLDKVKGATVRSDTATINFGEFINPASNDKFKIRRFVYHTSSSTDIPLDHSNHYVKPGTNGKAYIQVVVNAGVAAPQQWFGGGAQANQLTWHDGLHCELIVNGGIYGPGTPGQPGISIINGGVAVEAGRILTSGTENEAVRISSGTTQTAVEIINNGTIAGGGGAGASGHPWGNSWPNTAYVVAGGGGGAGQNWGSTIFSTNGINIVAGSGGPAGVVSGSNLGGMGTQYAAAGGASAASGQSGGAATAGGGGATASGQVVGYPGYNISYSGGAGGAGGGWGAAGGNAPDYFTETKSGSWSGTTNVATGFTQYTTVGGLAIKGLNRVVLTTTGTLIGGTGNI